MRHLGRTWRHRQKRTFAEAKPHDSQCADLRKWMLHQSSKSLLAETFNLVPFDFADTGRGLKTVKKIKPGTKIVSIPRCLLISPSDVLCSQMGSLIRRWLPAMTCQQVLSLFLMTERSRGENSAWHPFIQSLPGHYSLPHYFSSTELGYLLPHVRERAEKDRSRAQVVFAGVKQFCQHHWPNGVDWLSWEQFRWAWCTVSSRSVYLETEAAARAWLDLTHTDENNQAMCPYLDLINHSCVAQMRAGLNANTACYEIVTEDCFQAHDQVFISYGPHDNTVLFLSYGFTLPGNVHNCIFFSIEDFTELLEVFHVDCWAARREVLYQNGLHRQLVCNAEGISWSLRAALSILAMDVTQLHDCWRVLDKEAGHPDLEAHVLAMARCLLGRAFERTQQFLVDSEQKAQGQAPNRHIQLALSLARDEVSVLTFALENLS